MCLCIHRKRLGQLVRQFEKVLRRKAQLTNHLHFNLRHTNALYFTPQDVAMPPGLELTICDVRMLVTRRLGLDSHSTASHFLRAKCGVLLERLHSHQIKSSCSICFHGQKISNLCLVCQTKQLPSLLHCPPLI